MGKRPILLVEDNERLDASIKQCKLPLKSRTGLIGRAEQLRQIFQGQRHHNHTPYK